MVYEKMTAIANAIRKKTGGTDALTLDGIAAAIPVVYANGIAEKQAEIDGKFFAGYAKGNGTVTFSIAIPFEPDKVCIFCFGNATYNASVRTIMQYVADLAAVETVGSTSVHAQAANVQMGVTSIASTLKRCVYADGVLSATPYESNGYIWGKDATYTVIAIKEQ